MKDIDEKALQVSETCKGTCLKRRVGEGSFVGLKTIHNVPEEQIQWLKHLYAYRYAVSFAEGKSVLDAGCGTGYGVHELSTKATNTIAIDIWKEGTYYCHQEHCKEAVFLTASVLNVPFSDNSFDLVVSFQVIEHIDPGMVTNYLEEIRRVLKNNGIFLVSTPNRRLRLLPFQKPWNPDHKKEYDAKELESMIKKVFENVETLGLFAKKDAYSVEYYRVKQKPFVVYAINPTISIAKRILPACFIDALMKFAAKRRKSGQRSERRKNMSYDFSLKDFHTSRQNLDACIDLYGICIKNEIDLDADMQH